MRNPLNILLLEDSEDDFGLISFVLRKEGIPFFIERVDNENSFSKAIDEFRPDVILSDHALPQFNSIEAFKLYKSKKLSIPFILVTGTVSEEFAVNILKQGVDDYILKSNLSRLPSAIQSAIEKRDAEREKMEIAERLSMQNQELIKVNNELDNFVYSVSHNLRAPLLSVLGLISIVNSEIKPDVNLTKYLKMMEGSILQLDHTLKDILEYSHNAHDEIKVQRINFDSLIENCFNTFQHIDGLRQVDRKINVEEKTPLYSDARRISIVLRNLVSNAINFRDLKKDKSIISITILVDHTKVTISIEDNGVGIDIDLMPKIYNLFFRGNVKSQGAGLGLYVTREILNRLDGSIQIESKLDVGTIITIQIPNSPNQTES